MSNIKTIEKEWHEAIDRIANESYKGRKIASYNPVEKFSISKTPGEVTEVCHN